MIKLTPINQNLTFKEDTHQYFASNGKELISVSTLIKFFSPKFDPTGQILIRCAEKKGISPAELKKQWENEKNEAADKGKNFHRQAEYWAKNKKIDRKGDYKDVVKQITKIPFEGSLYPEVAVASVELGIAGTIDLIDEYKKKQVNIWDWKTNKELKKKSFYRREGGYQMMLEPVSHLMDCNFVHYSLQLHIYGIILEDNGYWVNDKTIVYINPKNRLIELHPILPLKREAENIIDYYNKMMKW